MTEINLKILDLLNQNKSIKEVSNILNISEKQLYVRIKQLINYGYNLEPVYYYNSDIYYNLKKNRIYNGGNTININMGNDENIFRCLVISDLHIGSVDADIKLVDTVYEYAAKNGINVILNGGDNIEGDYTSSPKSMKDVHSQIDYFIKKYPYDKYITNYMIFGKS